MGWTDRNGEPIRNHANHKERGPAKYTYTYEDIAHLTGMKVKSLHVARCRGDFDIEDLLSVATYICKKRGLLAP